MKDIKEQLSEVSKLLEKIKDHYMEEVKALPDSKFNQLTDTVLSNEDITSAIFKVESVIWREERKNG